MYMVIATTTGKIYYGDEVSEEDEIATLMEERHMPKRAAQSIFENNIAEMIEISKDFRRMKHVEIMYKGRSRYFNPENIEWVEFRREPRQALDKQSDRLHISTNQGDSSADL